MHAAPYFVVRCLLVAMALAFAPRADAGSGGSGDGACTKTVRWELQPPYNVVTEEGERSGYHVAVVRAALARLGCTAVIREMPWARGLMELEAGRLDLMPGMLATRERQRFARFSLPINLSPNLLFLSAEAASRNPMGRLSDLRGTSLRIGVERGAHYSAEYTRLLQDPQFAKRMEWVPPEQAWRMLESGRIDGHVSDQARALAAGVPLRPGPRDVRPVLVLSAEPARVAFSRRSVDNAFVRRFDEALESLRADGTLVALREHYIPCKADPVTLGCAEALEGAASHHEGGTR